MSETRGDGLVPAQGVERSWAEVVVCQFPETVMTLIGNTGSIYLNGVLANSGAITIAPLRL